MGRHGTAEEIAKAVVFLVSDDAGYITGEEITVDGGSQISMFHLVHQLAD
jgi:3-oxoacyl-[acyl-carrier protein] reductase